MIIVPQPQRETKPDASHKLLEAVGSRRATHSLTPTYDLPGGIEGRTSTQPVTVGKANRPWHDCGKLRTKYRLKRTINGLTACNVGTTSNGTYSIPGKLSAKKERSNHQFSSELMLVE